MSGLSVRGALPVCKPVSGRRVGHPCGPLMAWVGDLNLVRGLRPRTLLNPTIESAFGTVALYNKRAAVIPTREASPRGPRS